VWNCWTSWYSFKVLTGRMMQNICEMFNLLELSKLFGSEVPHYTINYNIYTVQVNRIRWHSQDNKHDFLMLNNQTGLSWKHPHKINKDISIRQFIFTQRLVWKTFKSVNYTKCSFMTLWSSHFHTKPPGTCSFPLFSSRSLEHQYHIIFNKKISMSSQIEEDFCAFTLTMED